MPTSTNGFAFDASIDNRGEHIIVTAHKDDHEGRKTEAFRFTPLELAALLDLLRGHIQTAKGRRKAIRKAAAASLSNEPEGV